MTIQQTIIACTAALLLGIYAMSDGAFWKPQEPWEVWCSKNDVPWMFPGSTCEGAWVLHNWRNR